VPQDFQAAGVRRLEVPLIAGRLPLAQARNAGAAAAIDAGAELLIFLDVDCIGGDRLLSRYAEVAQSVAPALLCGPVAYLPPPPATGYELSALASLAVPHAARPQPDDAQCERNGDHTLFWSLSFAVTVDTWSVLGGFCADYTGYGGEDTDLGQVAAAAGVELCWVGGAYAYHQHHPTAEPPTQHLDDILRNAGIFYDRWGWWPMHGWLAAFEQAGLVKQQADRWQRVDRMWPRLVSSRGPLPNPTRTRSRACAH